MVLCPITTMVSRKRRAKHFSSRTRKTKNKAYTWKLPGLASVEVNFSYFDSTKAPMKDLRSKIEGYKLFISWMESKAWRQTLVVWIFPIELKQKLFHGQHFPEEGYGVRFCRRKEEKRMVRDEEKRVIMRGNI